MVATFFLKFVPSPNKHPKVDCKNGIFQQKQNCFSPSPLFARCPGKFNTWYGAMEAKVEFYPIFFNQLQNYENHQTYKNTLFPLKFLTHKSWIGFTFYQDKIRPNRQTYTNVNIIIITWKTLSFKKIRYCQISKYK